MTNHVYNHMTKHKYLHFHWYVILQIEARVQTFSRARINMLCSFTQKWEAIPLDTHNKCFQGHIPGMNGMKSQSSYSMVQCLHCFAGPLLCNLFPSLINRSKEFFLDDLMNNSFITMRQSDVLQNVLMNFMPCLA